MLASAKIHVKVRPESVRITSTNDVHYTACTVMHVNRQLLQFCCHDLQCVLIRLDVISSHDAGTTAFQKDSLTDTLKSKVDKQ